MTYIPDARTDDNYNQRYLNQTDREFISGFDWNTENAVDNFFNNFEDFEDSYLQHILNTEVPEHMKEEYFVSFEDEPRKIETYLDLFRCKLLEWIEDERNEMITSMIDHMPDEEYQEIKERVDRELYEKDEAE